MRDGRDILNHRYFKTCCLQSTDGCLAAAARSLNKNLDGFQAMLHGGFGRGLCCGLRREGVDFLLPRKPIPPADAQESALPWVSVMVTMLLLKEELI